MSVFVYCTVKLLLDTGGVSDRKLLMLLGQELTEILSKKSWLGKWILYQEP